MKSRKEQITDIISKVGEMSTGRATLIADQIIHYMPTLNDKVKWYNVGWEDGYSAKKNQEKE